MTGRSLGAEARSASKSRARKNRQARFDQGIELLVEDEEIGAADSALPASTQSGENAAARGYRIDIQAAVHQLLARLRQGAGGLDMRKDAPVSVRDSTNKLPHSSSVYLIYLICKLAGKGWPLLVRNTGIKGLFPDRSRQRAGGQLLFYTGVAGGQFAIHNGHPGRHREVKQRVLDGGIEPPAR